MDMTGERRIVAPRRKVWDALNDPVILKASIPGCESLEKQADGGFKATATVKVGPMTGRFSGNVTLSDLDPPNGYTISGEGQGGVLGFAKGGAKVRLSDDGDATRLAYEVHAQVGGKMAQLGARLIDASAKQMADVFFDRFSALVAPPPAPFVAPDGVATDEALAPRPVVPPPLPPSAIGITALIPREPFGLPVAAWVGGAVYLVILILILGSLL